MPGTDNRVCHIHDLHVVRRAWLVHGNRGYPIIALVVRGLSPSIRTAGDNRYEQVSSCAVEGNGGIEITRRVRKQREGRRPGNPWGQQPNQIARATSRQR